jgi:hypothetical protein
MPTKSELAAYKEAARLFAGPACRALLTVTPTEHEKSEWSRMAKAAYAAGQSGVGHRYSMSAAYCVGQSMPLQRFDELQNGYRGWLCFSQWPTI